MKLLQGIIDPYQPIPKVELHRHLEGSLRLETIQEIARTYGLGLPGTGQLRPLVQVLEEEPYTAQNFLSKFATLRLFFRSPEIISRMAYEAIADAVADNVQYIELRFTPVALSRIENFPLGEVMDWVIAGVTQAKRQFNIGVNLIASVNRHESIQLAEEVARLAVERRSSSIVGLDLAGDETRHPARPFAGIFKEAHQAGMYITAHAGEWGGAENVIEAIQLLEAERIGHGIRILEDPRAVDLARERGTIFEVCITSNHRSGIVPSIKDHPLPRLLAEGLKITLNTDDPAICQITLSNEYKNTCEELGLPRNTLYELILTGARTTFLPEAERKDLGLSLQKKFANLPV